MNDQNIRKILVLGHRGMLGQMAVRYFGDRSYEVVTIPLRYEPETRKEFLAAMCQHPGAVVLNGIGRSKQNTDSVDELLWANAVLPLDLARGLRDDQILIHPSTDGVFSGMEYRPYASSDQPNATDDYGWSKQLGEIALAKRASTFIFRVSIIGPDTCREPKGLMGWFLAQPPGSKIKGYANYSWNGITTLEWCKQIENHLQAKAFAGVGCRTIHLGTKEYHTKYDLLKMIQDIFGTNHQIGAWDLERPVDRRLMPDIEAKPLHEQLIELIKYGH